MSVKFEKETITSTASGLADAAAKGKDDLLHEVGQALTKGGGPNGYLAVSVRPNWRRAGGSQLPSCPSCPVRPLPTIASVLTKMRDRPTSSSCRATRCAPRC